MNKYKFEKFKKNIFILNYNDKENNITFKKLIKIPITTCSQSMINNEYNNYKLLNKTSYSEYFEKNDNIFFYKNIEINTDLIINIVHNNINIQIITNIKDIINDNILSKEIFLCYFFDKKSDGLFSELKEYFKIDQLNNYYIKYITFLIMNYNENNFTFHTTINTYIHNINKIIELTQKCLLKLESLHKDLDFIHGDFKLNNILYDQIIDKITFIDLEFSIINNNKFIKTNNLEYINLYLNLENEIYISTEFLKFFDIYLFTFTFFMSKTLEYNNKFIMKLTEQNNLENISNNDNQYYYIFFILYKILYNYCITKNISFTNISDNEFYKYCTFNGIYKIFYFNKIFDDNKEIQNVILYIDNIFDDIFIQNKLKNNINSLIKINNIDKNVI